MLTRLLVVFFLFFCVSFSLLCCGTSGNAVFAASQSASPPSEERPTVKVGYIPGNILVHHSKRDAFIPYSGEGNTYDTSRNGYLYDLLQGLSPFTKVNYQLVPTELYEAVTSLAVGTIDVFGPTTMRPGRNVDLVFTDESFGMTQSVLVTSSSKKIFYDNPHQMDGKQVAILHGTHFSEALSQYLDEHNIHMQPMFYGNMESLRASSEEFAFLNTLYVPKDKQIAMALGTMQMRFVADIHEYYLLHSFDRGLNAALTHDRFFLHKLYEKYFLESSRKRPALTWSQTTWLSQHSPLVVGAMRDLNDDNVSVLHRAVLDYMYFLGTTYGFQVRSISIPQGLGNVTNDVDVLLSMLGEKDQIEERFVATKPAYMFPLVFLTHKKQAIDFAKDVKIASLNYLELDESLLRENYPNASLVKFDSVEQLHAAYVQGTVDVVLMTSMEEEYFLRIFGAKRDIVFPSVLELPFRLYIAKNKQPQATHIFNAFIDQTDSLQVERVIINALIASRPPDTIGEFFQKYLIYIITAILLLSGLYGTAILVLESRRKQQLLDVLNKDALTGVPSLYKFRVEVQQKLSTAMAGEYLLISFDIDGFGMINSVYGYERGNEFLRCVAQKLVQSFPAPSVVARAKDDIFLIFTKNNNLNRYSRSAAFRDDRLSDCAKEILDAKFPLSLSRGYYIIDEPQDNLDRIIDCCNMARERGKLIHGITNTMFTHEMRSQLAMRTQILLKMEQALTDQEFAIHYQPKVDLQTLRISGAEALVRWYPKDGSQIYPDAFIPLFEENGFIAQLDYYVFEHVCQFIQNYKKEVDVPPIAINLSGVTIMNVNTCTKLLELLDKYGLSSEEIEIEITESAVVDESAQFIKEIGALRDAGFHIAMDDFGSGVSSLNRLRTINVDVVKLDKAFLDDNLSEQKGIAVVENIVNLIKQLNMKVVAEGVETIEHTQWLTSIHCDIAQGYYFDRPLTPDHFVERLKGNAPRAH